MTMRLISPLLATCVAALALTLGSALVPAAASADRINAPSHDAGLGFHTIRFRTEDGDVYSLHALTLTFDYWVGRTYGLMLHGEAYFPMRGAQPGSDLREWVMERPSTGASAGRQDKPAAPVFVTACNARLRHSPRRRWS